MKVYSRIVIDMGSGLVVDELYESYKGPVALCKGPDIPTPPPPPKPPPLPMPPEIAVTEEKKRQEFLDKMLLQQRKRGEFLRLNQQGSVLGGTGTTLMGQGAQPKTLLGE